MSFEIKLPLFQGPFDLLLFFIERDELDIYDIPISKITKDFLDYLSELEKLNMDLASEFIWVAASLMRIKSKLLLPRPELDEEGNEIDPREELVKHLLEYKAFKETVADFQKYEDDRQSRFERGNILKEIQSIYSKSDVEAEVQHLDLYKLLKVYQKVTERYEERKNQPKHQVVQYPYSIEQQRDFIVNLTSKGKKVSFTDIMEQNTDKIGIIYNFLAILELLQLNKINITIGEGYNNFWIYADEGVSESSDH